MGGETGVLREDWWSLKHSVECVVQFAVSAGRLLVLGLQDTAASSP